MFYIYTQRETRPSLLPLPHIQVLHFLTLVADSVPALESSVSKEELSGAELMLTLPSLKKSPESSLKLSFTTTKQKWRHRIKHLNSPNSLQIVQQSLILLSVNGEPATPEKPSSREEMGFMNERTHGGCAVHGPTGTCVLSVTLRHLSHSITARHLHCQALRGRPSVHMRNMTTCITTFAWTCA